MAEKVFAKGLWAKKPHEKAPDFVVANISFKAEEFTAFLKEHTNDNGYVNIDLLKGKEGKYNAVLNDYQPKPKDEKTQTIEEPAF